MIKNVQEIVKQQEKKGLNTYKNFFNLEEGQSPACINVMFNNDGSKSKRLGSSTMNTIALESTGGYGMYDFGVLSSQAGNDGYTKLLLHCNGVDGSTSFADSALGKTVTAVGSTQIVTAQSKFGGASGYFVVGSGDYLSLADSTDWAFGTGNFTIDKQIRFRLIPDQCILMTQFVDGNNLWQLVKGTSSGGNKLSFTFIIGGVTKGNYIMTNSWAGVNTATWYHLVFARNGTSAIFFIDGSSQTLTESTAFGTNDVGDLGTSLNIGGRTTTLPFDGWMDEIRISKGITRWTVNFTPPTAEYVSNLLQQKKLLCASGTGIYYSADIGKTWAIAQTNRTAAINYFGFVKDYVINTNENYDLPQYWAGTDGTYFANISTAAPTCKHSLSHQGFCILLNESANKTSFYYVDQNSMFNSAFSYFKFPTDRNDELTGGFSLNDNLYVSSKYKLFRLYYIGGNPDWIYKEVRGWGFVPRTIKKLSLPTAGEVIIGLDWTKKLRIFTGSEDEIISDVLQTDNGITPFYLDNINMLNLSQCWAENDRKAQVYRLYLVYGDSSTTSYCLNFNYRTGALYPEDGRPYQSGVLASDTADNLFMLACNYNGRIHIIDSGNAEGTTPINDYYVSPLFYRQSPSRVHKAQQIDMFYSVSSSGNLYLEDRSNFSTVWNLRKEMTMVGAISSLQIRHTIDIPETVNTYQFKLSSSANTAEPWQLNLIDYSNSELGIGRG